MEGTVSNTLLKSLLISVANKEPNETSSTWTLNNIASASRPRTWFLA